MLRRCVITGITGGIGSRVSRHLRETGFDLVGVGRNRPLEWTGDFVTADLASEADLDMLPEVLQQRVDHVWALINIAGQGVPDSVEELNAQTLIKILTVNSVAPAVLARACVPIMRQGGRIVSVSSIIAAGKSNRSSYAASKAALNALSSCWAKELGARGITSNIVSPGPVDTALLRSVVPSQSPAEVDLLSKIPTGRFTDPHDIAHLISFLLSDAAQNVTGQVIHIDGGLLGAAG